jgi:NAD(P)-dependent dehydrogenase (short-subunit alcohol dehydrogenase family)
MEPYFKGKTVLVTGAGWGVGAVIALLYATYGAKVIVSDTSRRGGKDTVARIKSQNGDATYIKTDISNAQACEKLIRRTILTYGSIDIACNNSAIFAELRHPPEKDMEESADELGLRLNGLNNCMQYEIEAMQKQGGGVIINTSSIIGVIGLASLDRYVDAKYGMVALPREVQGEYSAGGIHISTIAPAFISTAISKATFLAEKKRPVKLSPLNKLFKVQELTGLILWLSSDETHLLPTVPNDNNN